MAFNQYKQYLIVTRWVFDFSHYEYCSITLEGGEADDIVKMFSTDDPADNTGVYTRLIKKITDAQNGNPMDINNCKPVAVYRVVGPNQPYENVGLPVYEGSIEDMKSIKFDLELIGLFDRDGRPISVPVAQSVPV